MHGPKAKYPPGQITQTGKTSEIQPQTNGEGKRAIKKKESTEQTTGDLKEVFWGSRGGGKMDHGGNDGDAQVGGISKNEKKTSGEKDRAVNKRRQVEEARGNKAITLMTGGLLIRGYTGGSELHMGGNQEGSGREGAGIQIIGASGRQRRANGSTRKW